MRNILTMVIAIIAVTIPALGQTDKPVVPTWTGSFGAGLALTNGNTDTKNINVSTGFVRDPKKRSLQRMNALYLRGDKDGLRTVDRATVTFRNELKVSDKAFVFVQGDYAKDVFKQISYLISPTAGVGYKFVNTDTRLFAIDNGLGGIWERDKGLPTKASGAYNVGERLMWKPSKTATITQSIASLYKTNDWSDSLHNFSVALSASVTSRTELKVEFLDSYKNRPALATIKKNDTAVVTALVLKF